MIRLIREYIVPRLLVDILIFFVLLSLLGLVAARLTVDGHFWLGAVANYLMLVFAFVINDIEDRADDAQSHYVPQSWQNNLRMSLGMHTVGSSEVGGKRFRNIFSDGTISPTSGYLWCVGIFLVAMILSFWAGGYAVMLLALSNMVIGILYSWRLVRLKSRPVLDLISHAYLLAGAQILYFLSYPTAEPDIWGVLLAVLVFANSISGDLRNEYRDFDEDQAHGIRNTASLVGKRAAYVGGNVLNLVSVGGIVLVVVMIVVG